MGIGNLLLGDEGVGVHAARELIKLGGSMELSQPVADTLPLLVETVKRIVSG